jgi:hypothetical protein
MIPNLDAIKILFDDPQVTECLFLVKHNIPFDVAFSLDAEMRAAWVIRMSSFEGNEFDWVTGTWVRQNEVIDE